MKKWKGIKTRGLFNFWGGGAHFCELSPVKTFFRVLFHEEPHKTNIFAINIFLPLSIFYKAECKVHWKLKEM